MEKEKYAVEFEKIVSRMSRVYRSAIGLRNAKKYITGLLSPAERKNGWQLSEEIGEKTPYKLQQFLYRGSWSADMFRDVTRE